MLRNLALAFISVLLVMVLAVVGDRVYGRFFIPYIAHLIYPPYSVAHHRSTEFDLTVRINNLGFRGDDVSIAKQKKRVLLIGDSFTFGWGVEEQQTWVRLLQSQYPELEILNLGQGGTHPGDHVRLARKAVPLLQPDAVVMCVLRGNDLHQLMRVIAYERGDYTPSFPTVDGMQKPVPVWTRLRNRLFPNLFKRFPRPVEIGDRWKQEADALLASFSQEQQERYARLDAEVRNAFETGRLNASLIFGAMHFPEAYCVSADTTEGLLRDAMVRLRDHMGEFWSICEQNNAASFVLSLPDRPYGCADCVPDLLRLGYDAMGCDTLDADTPVRWSAQQAGISSHIVGDSLRITPDMFFALDGHWNNYGHRIFAEHLSEVLKTEPEWNSLKTSGSL